MIGVMDQETFTLYVILGIIVLMILFMRFGEDMEQPIEDSEPVTILTTE